MAATYQALPCAQGCTALQPLRCLASANMKLSFLAQSYEAAVTLDPDQAQAWMNMGGIRHIQVGVALTVFSPTLDLKPLYIFSLKTLDYSKQAF